MHLTQGFYLWILAILLLAQATWIFTDARRRGEDYYWLWGFFGLLNIPSSLLIYLLVTRGNSPRCPACRRRQTAGTTHCRRCGRILPGVCQECGQQLRPDWSLCPRCGKALGDEKAKE